MSKLSKALRDASTSRTPAPTDSNYFRAHARSVSRGEGDIVYYRLQLMFSAQFALSSEADAPGALEHHKKSVIHMIIREVFGEFHPLIDAIEDALYRGDFEATREAIHDLRERMFHV
jgi:hypothetical protein